MGAALGAVHDITKEPIAEAEAKAKEDAYKEVFADAATIEVFADDNISIDQVNEAINKRGFTDVYVDELNVAKNESDEALGLIFLVTNSSGYGGDLQMAVGVTIEKRICGVKFLKISETAGLGMEAQKPEFLEQFIDKPVGVFTYTKTGSTSDSEIDALSGATITTSAVVDTINAVLSCIKGGY
ncbi:MAG: FMN-binding protein [Eubacteriales bacterium]|nr:FMN-binding protein [Lachnospiraceae bacterium]MDO5126198.1 FMN-binding protein [Eubacteriales bacterium]